MKPTIPLTLKTKIKLVLFAIFRPQRFVQAEILHNSQINEAHLKRGPDQSQSRINAVRSALWNALQAFAISCTTGAALGALSSTILGKHIGIATTVIVCGTGILLWATLALQGWSIQSFKGETLTERVNQWIFRTLYCFGTFLICWGTLWSVA
ncbi:hypothetical protein [Rhizobium sp. CAU 1783]